jgi:hypothetical protein
MRIRLIKSTSPAQEQRKRIVLLLIVHDATCTTAVNASFGKVVIIVQIPSDPSFIRHIYFNLLSIYQLFVLLDLRVSFLFPFVLVGLAWLGFRFGSILASKDQSFNVSPNPTKSILILTLPVFQRSPLLSLLRCSHLNYSLF